MLRAVHRRFPTFSLSKTEQAHRSSLFDPSPHPPIHYHYNLALHPGHKYQGLAEIRFRLARKGDLFLDFRGRPTGVVVNGGHVELGAVWDGKGRIRLREGMLRDGDNRVAVQYENQYDREGSGCVSFIDVDAKQYLYTQFEPYQGNRVFPMFDQPDLKARMQLSIACPSEWQAVLSNQNQDPSQPQHFTLSSPACPLTQKVLSEFQSRLPVSYKLTQFPATRPLPSYLFCFVVGPYQKHALQPTHRNLPMNLYCIQSLYPHMLRLVPFISEMTNLSMKFFEEYFGYPYPFAKYDQVFAHEYKWGAMENAGIVTLNDGYIFRDPVSQERMIGFGNTIVHEMAHHWFGNLVTMRWWDDLWLNQSFAEYISHYCLEKIKGQVTSLNYESAMVSFLNRKGWGYMEDQLITTHPIRSDVANTQVAESIFDGITYSKGAATMKQLMYLMGEQAFSAALKEYFWAHQFRNAELEDLLHCMKKHYKGSDGVTIDQWRQAWLEKAGLNIIEHELDQGRSVLRIRQSAYHTIHPTLRPHRIKIGLVLNPRQIDHIQVTVRPQPVTQITLTPSQLAKFKQAKAILLNHDDLSFVKVIVDNKSLQYFKHNINKIQDVLFRSMVWRNVYGMVQDGKIKTREFVEMLANNIREEQSDLLFQENLTNAIMAIQRYVPASAKGDNLPAPTQSRKLLYEKLPIHQRETMQKNRGVIIRDRLIALSDSDPSLKHLQTLVQWIQGDKDTVQILGHPNITQKWKIVIKILQQRKDKQKNQQLLERMIKEDTSDVMKNKKLTCENILLQGQEFISKFRNLTHGNPKEWSRIRYIHALSGLNCRKHRPLLQQYSILTEYFKILKQVLTNPGHVYSTLSTPQLFQSFLDHMDPILEDTLAQLETKKQHFQALAAQKINNDKHRINILKKIDTLGKRIKCYQLYSN